MPAQNYSANSLADEFRTLAIEERQRRINLLTEDEAEDILRDWEFWRRDSQKLPEGDWTYWLVRAGRGFGKTRVGSETVRIWAKTFSLVNLIGATADDARDVMIEGESGILSICPPSERPEYVKSLRRLTWPNGSISMIFTADEPERLRGKQHCKLWCDELAAWRYPEAWDQAMFGLRLGTKPQAVITTTPKPIKMIRDILADKNTIESRGTSYENRINLAPAFLEKIVVKYEGTRLGRQELNAEILEDNPNALWRHDNIDSHRIKKEDLPALQRIVIPVDPAVTSNEDSDETGIVPVGRDDRYPPHFYVLDDLTLSASPKKWGEAAVAAYKNLKADRIIGEANNGGDLVEANLRSVDQDIPYKCVRATRGKEKRAEPIAALYEQGRVHHVGSFPQLEDQMCNFNPADPHGESPDRMDSLVWGIWELSEGIGNFTLAEALKEVEAEVEAQKVKKVKQIIDLAKPHVNGDTPGCPKCPNKVLIRIQNRKRCNTCGWEETQPVITNPAQSRAELMEK